MRYKLSAAILVGILGITAVPAASYAQDTLSGDMPKVDSQTGGDVSISQQDTDKKTDAKGKQEDTNANTLQSFITSNLPDGADWSSLTTVPFAFQGLDGSGDSEATRSVRVSVNLNNEKVRDAIKKVIGKSDVTYDVDSDVPEDTRVTLKMENVTLTTALNALIESAGVGCKVTSTHILSDTTGKHTMQSRVHYQFTKRHTGQIGGMSRTWFTSPNAKYGNAPLNMKLYDLGGGNTTLNQLGKIAPFVTQKGDWPGIIYNLSTNEQRSTFTCPHCKEQVTIIKKNTPVKCPTCGRTFQDNWKFCPADGTKRPEETGDWKFCPHCGKPISP